ncbi:MAG: ASKHA domain-containing protein, partial [Planctomycetota bacterium]
AASCAAGPALEGAGITFGSRGQSGAIERVVFNDEEIDVDVIGTVQATSLCGSGLIDAVAVLLELGIVDITGRFCDRCEMDPMLPDTIRKRYITYNDEPAFVLAGNFAGGQWENMVLLTQKDLRQIQLAKAAIRAGIELLLNKAGNSIPEIQQLLLAGAFGNYIQKKSAVRIGLLPPIPLEKIHFVGNAAGSGAQMALISQDARTTAIKLAETTDYIEIAHQADFQTVFSEFLLFPEN